MFYREGGRHWAVNYISSQRFVISFSYLLTLGTCIEFWLGSYFIKFRFHTLQPLIVIYRMGHFVYHNWGYTIYIYLSAIALSLTIPGRRTCLISESLILLSPLDLAISVQRFSIILVNLSLPDNRSYTKKIKNHIKKNSFMLIFCKVMCSTL